MKRSAVFLSLAFTAIASSQTIPIKTVPLATGSQYLLFPSQSLAIGGVSISMYDPWGDPYLNPASPAGIEGIRLVASPMYYGITMMTGTSGESSGRTLPLGILFQSGDYFGGLTWARQSISPENGGSFSVAPSIAPSFGLPTLRSRSGSSHINTYTFGTLGYKFPGTQWSIGASVLWGDLTMIDGIQHLYPGAEAIQPSGSVAEYRIGVNGTLEGDRTLQMILSHQKTDMKHMITRVRWISPTDDPWLTIPVFTDEIERDHTTGYGIRVSYHQPLNSEWRMGGTAVGNWKSHPKIPNYELMNIPRDPGHSFASQMGIGLSRHGKKGMVGFDLLYEPIASDTWAEADAPVTTISGSRIPIGGKTIENTFSFYNYIVRVGVRSAGETSQLSAGINFHRIKYYLKQINHVEEIVRRQKEEWTEFTFSAGLGFHLFGARVHYLGLLTTGTGRPGIGGGRVWDALASGPGRSDFLVAPSGILSLDEAFVVSHQITVSVDLE